MIKVEISPGKKRLSEEWETIGIGGDIDKTFEWGKDKFPYKKDFVYLCGVEDENDNIPSSPE